MDKLTETTERIKKDISFEEEHNSESMDERDWGSQYGILISVNEAKQILNLLSPSLKKQRDELKPLSEITDQEKMEMISVLWPTSITATIKDVDFILYHFTGEYDGGLDVREAIGAYQYLQPKNYELPIYFPFQKGDGNG